MTPATRLTAQDGFAMTMALVLMATGAIVVLTAMTFFQSDREQEINESQRSTRDFIQYQVESALQSEFIVRQSMLEHNDATSNSDLVNCLEAPSPDDCADPLGFHLVLPGQESLRMAGPPGNEAHFDPWGNPCDGNGTGCLFRSRLLVAARCPSFSPTSCPGTKILTFSYLIEKVGVFSNLVFRPATSDQFIEYSADRHSIGTGMVWIR